MPVLGSSFPKDINHEDVQHDRYRLRSRYKRDVGAVGSATGCRPEGDGFEPRTSRQFSGGSGRLAGSSGREDACPIWDAGLLGVVTSFAMRISAGFKTLALHYEEKIMLTMLHTLGPLWRLCTTSLYRVRPGGTAGLQNRRFEFDSRVPCLYGRWSSGQAPDCKSGLRGFKSRPAVQIVVRPTRCRIAATSLTPG